MKTLFATLAAATAVAAIAVPAAAQSYDRDGRYERSYDRDGRYEQRHDNGAYNINARQAQLNQRIEAGLRRGTLTANETQHLRIEARAIASVEQRYRRGGLNWNERADLDRRLDRLEMRLVRESRDRDYGWNHYNRR
jgi:hypothetical protein